MKILKFSILALWVVAISVIVGIMHSWHYADLSPEEPSVLSIDKFSSKVEMFGVIHFLTPACSCSQNIYEHLIGRNPMPEERAKESIVLFDDSSDLMKSNLKQKGYQVFSLRSEDIDKESKGSVRGVPLLVIYDSKKVTKYVGGYSSQAITPFTDINIDGFLDNINSGRTVASNPVVGCAVSNEYKKLLDPFGLKYKGKE